MSQLSILLSNYVLEDVYNMDESELYFKAHPNKILAQRKVKGRKLQNKREMLLLIMQLGLIS